MGRDCIHEFVMRAIFARVRQMLDEALLSRNARLAAASLCHAEC